jgi:SHS2 domain-containing protein
MNRAPGHWEHFAHEADVGVRGIGVDMRTAFEQAALALTAVVTDPASVHPMEMREFECEAPDEELLLVDWLNALIYSMGTDFLLYSKFDVAIAGTRLRARAWGEGLDVDRHRPAVEVKGATFTELAVRQRADGSWVAQCVVDV